MDGEVTMASLITDLASVASGVLTQVSAVTATIVGDPFLLLTTGVLFVGAAVGIVGRILSRG